MTNKQVPPWPVVPNPSQDKWPIGHALLCTQLLFVCKKCHYEEMYCTCTQPHGPQHNCTEKNDAQSR
jgi:hypothetical protein